MHTKPMVLVQPPGEEKEIAGREITVIAVYSGEAPISVATRRVFDGETRFKFPTEVTEGLNKTRVVYSYTPEQWRELIQVCVAPGSQGGLRQVMIPLLLYFKENYRDYFSEIEYDTGFDPDEYAEIVKLK